MSDFELEDMFTPHPGSSRDAVNKMNDAAQPKNTSSAEPGGTRNPKPVKVEAFGQTFSAARRANHFTVVVSTTTNPVQQILPPDPNRTEAQVLAVDNPVVLSQSQDMAWNPANQVTDTPFPAGSYLPVGYDRPILNCDELWVAATSSTASRVSVIVNYKD